MEEDPGRGTDGDGDPEAVVLSDGEVDGGQRQAHLPCDTDGDVHHVAFEVGVPLKVRILSDDPIVNRFPETPWTDGCVELL